MNGRAAHFLLLAMLVGHAAEGSAAAEASGRNWRISLHGMHCETAGSLLVIGMRVRYLGPRGPVEAPMSELIGGGSARIPPRSLLWKDGSREHARWLSTGGLANVQSEYIGEALLRFEVRGATGNLDFVFGDIKAFSLTRKGASAAAGVCESLLKPGQVQAPRVSRPVPAVAPKLRVYREAYPCLAQQGALQTIEANQPPHAPRQMLLLGRGYLPNARQVELPMDKVPAQSYFYAGVDNLRAVEDIALRAIAADFPEYRAGLVAIPAAGGSTAKKFFAFNWGLQKAQSGNDLYSIGIYDLRPCAK